MKILKNKKGSVLLLSLLVTSALLVSVLYINTISLRQNIQVTNIDNSLHSYHGAESSNEEALYWLRLGRYEHILALNGELLDVGDTSVRRTVSTSLDMLTASIRKDEFFAFDIFDPDNLGSGSGLSYLSIDWDDDCPITGSWIELTSNEWGDDVGSGWNYDQSHIKKSLLNLHPDVGEDPLNHIKSVGGSDFSPDKAYQFRIKALYCNISNLRIKAFDESGRILPFLNVYNITSVAEYPKGSSRANKQALSINFKKNAPLSGLFDYVIFSEESLMKDIGANTSIWFDTDFYIAEPDYLNIPTGSFYSHEILTINGKSPYKCTITGAIPRGLEVNNCSFYGTVVQGGLAGGSVYRIFVSIKDSSSPPKGIEDRPLNLIIGED